MISGDASEILASSNDGPEAAAPNRALAMVKAPGLYLDVNRYDHMWDEESGTYMPRTQVKRAEPEQKEKERQYAFTILRSFSRVAGTTTSNVQTEIEIRSPYFVMAAKEVMKAAYKLSWSATPLRMKLEVLLGQLPEFDAYRMRLEAKSTRSHEESLILEHVAYFLQFMRTEFSQQLSELNALLAQNLITYDTLWGILIPGTPILSPDKVYSHPMAMRLVSTWTETNSDGTESLVLDCEYLQRVEKRMGLADFPAKIPKFTGAKKISELEAFPLDWHPRKAETRRMLLERGHKWHRLGGVHHMYYEGIAIREIEGIDRKQQIKSRVMIDKDKFFTYSGYTGSPPPVERTVNGENLPPSSDAYDPSRLPPEDVLILTGPYLFGFSLADKQWFWFDLNHLHDIRWSEAAFQHLALPAEQKELITSLIESHTQHGSMAIDDFIEGKGQGLVISLFGPPGVGKTLTAEVTSEHTRRPLYVVGADEVGSNAGDLEKNLPRIFTLASSWNAVVLLDEAEVFLEQRSATDLTRNAIVAVLLRQIEYFPGILFLTTNREVVFDEALQSRIHISINYPGLSMEAKRSIWLSFLKRAGQPDIPEAVIRRLSSFDLNGRQIKNAVNTASILAKEDDKELNLEHVMKVISINELNGFDMLEKREKEREKLMDLLMPTFIGLASISLAGIIVFDPAFASWRTMYIPWQ